MLQQFFKGKLGPQYDATFSPGPFHAVVYHIEDDQENKHIEVQKRTHGSNPPTHDSRVFPDNVQPVNIAAGDDMILIGNVGDRQKVIRFVVVVDSATLVTINR